MRNVDRPFESERLIIVAHIPSPENRSLQKIDAIILVHRKEPMENLASYRRAARMCVFPLINRVTNAHRRPRDESVNTGTVITSTRPETVVIKAVVAIGE